MIMDNLSNPAFLEAMELYNEGVHSTRSIAAAVGVSRRTICTWIKFYKGELRDFVLTEGDSVRIGDDIVIKVLEKNNFGSWSLGIGAPKYMVILRKELLEQKKS